MTCSTDVVNVYTARKIIPVITETFHNTVAYSIKFHIKNSNEIHFQHYLERLYKNSIHRHMCSQLESNFPLPFTSQHLDNLLFMFIMKPLSFWRKCLLGSTHQHERLHRSISPLSIWLTSHPIALVVECLRFNLATKMSNNCIKKKLFHAEDREFCWSI